MMANRCGALPFERLVQQGFMVAGGFQDRLPWTF